MQHRWTRHICSFLLIFLFGCSLVLLSGSHEYVSADYRTNLSAELDRAAGQDGANFGEQVDPRLAVVLMLRVLFGFIGTGFLLLTIWAGFQMLTARGNDEQFSTGMKALQRGIIGIIIMLSSYSITLFATSFFEVDNRPSGNGAGGEGAPYRQNERFQEEYNNTVRDINSDPLNQDTTPVQFDPLEGIQPVER